MPSGQISKGKIKAIILSLILIITVVLPIINASNYKKTLDNICPCTTNSYSYGNWSFSEHIPNGTLEETWCECNETYWEPYEYSGNWTYSVNGTGIIPIDLFYTHLNNSGCNRTQTLVWTNYTTEDETEVYPGVIFDWHNCSDWTGVFFGRMSGYVLHWNGTTLIDGFTFVPVEDERDATDYYHIWGYLDGLPYYESAPDEPLGCWIKVIYNAHCGRLYAKIWGNFMSALGLEYEPSGWLINETFPTLASDDGTCYGLAYWNPSSQSFRGNFDYFEHWQLNYSTNGTSSWDVSDKRPHMKFPVIDMMDPDVRDEAFEWYNGTMANLTDITMRDILINITNLYNMESRFYQPSSLQLNDQNDTVYYYSALLTNFSTWYNEYIGSYSGNQTLAHNCLMFWIQDCTDGDASFDLDEGFIAINVDDDDTWDNNDRAWLWDIDWDGDVGTGWQWNGSAYSNWTIFATAWNTTNISLKNMHRYNNHINYLALIPLDELKNESGIAINVTDTFGLCIATYNMDDSHSCYWQNWNETECDSFVDESHNDAKLFFLNHTYLEDGPLNINSTNLGRWGQGEIEDGTLAEYIPQECCLNTTIKVWDNDSGTWKRQVNFSKGDKGTFNISVHNCGSDLQNLTIRITHFDAIHEYINNSGRLKLPNEAPISMNPNMTSVEGGDCGLYPHGHLQWNITKQQLVNFSYCNHVYLEFNMTINSTNYSGIEANASLCEWWFEYWDSNCTDEDMIYVNQKYNDDIECNCTGLIEASNWSISEHVHRPCTDSSCLDEEWFEYTTNYTTWQAYNSTWDFFGSTKDWEWTYRFTSYDNSTDDLGLSYTIANNSCANRTMSILRARYNVTMQEMGILPKYHPHIGIVYAYHNNSNYDMALYSYHRVVLLSKRNDSLYDTPTGKLIEDTVTSYDNNITNFYNESWSCNSTKTNKVNPSMNSTAWLTDGYGVWIKSLYNSLCGSVQTKAWNITSSRPFGLQYEPSGWIADETSSFIEYDEGQCFGLAVWNPHKFLSDEDNSFYADFDSIDVWRLNYSRDGNATPTQVENHNIYKNDGIPLMYFPVFDYNKDYYWTIDYQFYYECFLEWSNGNITSQEYADCAACNFRNLTKLYNMESRMARPLTVNCSEHYTYDNQNDTIYYYSAVWTNISGEVPYNNTIVIHIEECTDGTDDYDDAALVAIDVDNDMSWDDNDMCFLWFGDTFWPNTHVIIWNGTNVFAQGDQGELMINAWFDIFYERNATYWTSSYWSHLPVLHRYSNHKMYDCNIPLYYFEKESVGSGNYLNANDTFGIHVQTVHVNALVDGAPSVAIAWENWNESSCSTYKSEDAYSVWEDYMNVSNDSELADMWFNGIWNGVGFAQTTFWAHGRIGDEYGSLDESFWSTNVSKTTNKSGNLVEYSDVDTLVEFNITVCNNGQNIVRNVTVNDTLPPGVVYVGSGLPAENVTNPYDNCYIFNISEELGVDDCFTFNITVNFTGRLYPNGTIVINWANVTTDRNANSSANCSIQYGTNIAPQINWSYPDGDSLAELLLANISAGIADKNGDTMDVYFFTNKTTSWTNSWNPIGSNLSVNNGTYQCNQTFNNTQRYTTKWRWGNTGYWYSVNVTDGKIWTNETFNFTTDHSRYDTDLDDTVFVGDLNIVWANRGFAYLGVYDTDADSSIFVGDLNIIWANR